METVLSIDLGTSNCRSAVFTKDMAMISLSSKEYPLINISASNIEQNPDLWWNSVKGTMKNAITAAKDKGKNICSISISAQGLSLLPVDRTGKPLCNAISWLDTRAEVQTQEFINTYGFNDIFRYSGKRANAIYTLPKLLWFKEHHPELYQKTYKFLLPLDFLHHKLCGGFYTDHTTASGTMYYNITAQGWAEDILKNYHLDPEKLPEIVWSGTSLGYILPELADELGISHSVTVAAGGQDQKCAALGAGITEGTATISLGTASCISYLSDMPIFDPQCRIPCFSFLTPGQWALEGIVNVCSPCYDWFRQTFAEGVSFEELDARMEYSEQVPDEFIFFYPFFTGASSPYWLPDARPTFTGMSLTTDKWKMCRSILEGIACNIQSNLLVMAAICQPAKELRIYGGGANSRFYPQLIANVTNTPVTVLTSSETALAGAALLALKAINDIPSASAEEKRKVYVPDPGAVSLYRNYYNQYEKTRVHFFEKN